MKKIIFISAVSGVGKSTTCEYIKNNNLLDGYVIYDIDDLENVNNYDENTYNLFYENAIIKAIQKSGDKNIIIGSCINPTDFDKISIIERIDSYKNILITCSEIELTKRLRDRDKSRNCDSDEFISGQINYQNYMLNHLDLYDLHLDNTNCSIEEISYQIVKYIKSEVKKNN